MVTIAILSTALAGLCILAAARVQPERSAVRVKRQRR
jgi:hypothetical protein